MSGWSFISARQPSSKLITAQIRSSGTTEVMLCQQPLPPHWPVIAAPTWKQKYDWRCASLLQRCAAFWAFFVSTCDGMTHDCSQQAMQQDWEGLVDGGRESNRGGSWSHHIWLKCEDYRPVCCSQHPEGSAKPAGSFIKHQLRWCSTTPVLTVTPSDRFPTLLLGDSRDGSKRIKRLNPRLNRSTVLWNVATSTQGSGEHLQSSLQTSWCTQRLRGRQTSADGFLLGLWASGMGQRGSKTNQQLQQLSERQFCTKVGKLVPGWSSNSSSLSSSHLAREILMLSKTTFQCHFSSFFVVVCLASGALSETCRCYLKLLLTLQMKELLNRAVFHFQTGCKCDSTTEIQFTGLFLLYVQWWRLAVSLYYFHAPQRRWYDPHSVSVHIWFKQSVLVLMFLICDGGFSNPAGSLVSCCGLGQQLGGLY